MTSLPDDILDLLVAYALDALEPHEIVQVHALLEQQPELRRTLAELRATADQLPYALPTAEPPTALRERVLAHATGRGAPRPAAGRPAPARHGWLLALGFLAALAIVAAVVGWAQLFGTEAELAQARSELARVQSDLATVQATRQQVVRVILQTNSFTRLEGSGSATLLRGADGEAVLAAQLPPLQPGRVYQLWLIQGTNAPVSAGTFTVDQQGRGILTLSPSQQTLSSDVVAVTNEPDPGSPAPTSKPLIAGTIRSS